MKKKSLKPKVSHQVLKMEDADNVNNGFKTNLSSYFPPLHFTGCWRTLPHHGHNQEEAGGAEGGGGQTEGGGGIPQQDQQGQTAPQTAGADKL